MPKTRTTDYPEGIALEIIETTFHDYPLGTRVVVIGKDWHSYLVKNITRVHQELRYWWVYENQIREIPPDKYCI